MATNPYNWQSHTPQVQVPRPDVELVVKTLLGNGSAVVLGGRGMGKSVFLGQLKAQLEREEGTRVLLVETPPPTLTVEACLESLARRLGVPPDQGFDSREIFNAFFSRDDAPKRLILLFDEFDRYAGKATPSVQPPGRGFFNDLEASRRSMPQLAILSVGSIGVYVFRDILGSSFLSRALHLHLKPFDHDEAVQLTAPFGDRGTPLSEDVLDALLLSSGGIPSLLTYGLQELWERPPDATARDVTVLYKDFDTRYKDYLRDLLSAVNDPRLSDAPFRVWKYIQENAGRIRRSELEKALGKPSGPLNLDLRDALHLLQAVGLLRAESPDVREKVLTLHPIPSVLEITSSTVGDEEEMRADFQRDLVLLLSKLHRSSIDFFRTDRKEGRSLVPESVFSAHLALGFELLGWRSERESQRGAGRTDLLLRRNGDAEVIVVEVKIWGRHNYKDAHRQVESYWTDDVAFAAIVQLTDADLPDWPERYRRECLSNLTAEEVSVEKTPIQARLKVRSTTPDGLEAQVDHFLLRLPRRDGPTRS